jgi:DNA-binding beta-propeller fold protein YncE
MRVLKLLTLMAAVTLLLSLVAAAQTDSASQTSRSLIEKFHVGAGTIVTVAGGAPIVAGSDPKQASMLAMSGVAVDLRRGYLYVTDSNRHMIYRISPDLKSIEPFAGTGVAGFNGDGGRALETQFHVPTDLAVDARNGDVYLADTHNYRIRRIRFDGSQVDTVAGMGIAGIAADDIPTEFPLVGPHGRRSDPVFSGDGASALRAELNQPMSVALDRAGNVFIADTGNHRIRMVNTGNTVVKFGAVKIDPGNIATIGGTGSIGFSGDGGLATEAKFDTPRRLRITPDGDILFVDMLNNRVRRIHRSTGFVTTEVAGTGIEATQAWTEVFNVDWSVDGLAVTEALADGTYNIVYSDLKLHSIFQAAVPQGNYFPITYDPRYRTLPSSRELTPTQWLLFRNSAVTPRELIAGSGAQGRSDDKVKASRAKLFGTGSVAVGRHGEIFFVDLFNQTLWKVSDGIMSVVTGRGSVGENVAATKATLGTLASIDVSSEGDVYFPDMFLHKIRKIDGSNGTISTYAGQLLGGHSGDGGPPAKAQFVSPLMLTIDGNNMYVSDPAIPVIRKIVRSPQGDRVEHLAGKPFTAGPFEIADGIPASGAQLGMPQKMARNPVTNELYFADSVLNVIRKIDTNGIITTVGGLGPPWHQGYNGDGHTAIESQFNWPSNLLFDKQGNLFVTDVFNHRIRRIDADGTVSTFAGTGVKGFGGDGGPATDARLNNPVGICWDKNGDMYIADSGNHRIRKVEMRPPYRVSTVVGTGRRGFSGDFGPADQAQLNQPRGVAIGPDNTLYITDSMNQRIRAVKLPS